MRVLVCYGRQVDPPAAHACGPGGIQAVSRNRFALSSMLRLSGDRAIEQHLRQVVVSEISNRGEVRPA